MPDGRDEAVRSQTGALGGWEVEPQGNILRGSVNVEYLFSNDLGLLVDLLPIGHVAKQVVALCSRQSDLCGRFFEALLRAAPQDYLP